jgi:hypothetical protein
VSVDVNKYLGLFGQNVRPKMLSAAFLVGSRNCDLKLSILFRGQPKHEIRGKALPVTLSALVQLLAAWCFNHWCKVRIAKIITITVEPSPLGTRAQTWSITVDLHHRLLSIARRIYTSLGWAD